MRSGWLRAAASRTRSRSRATAGCSCPLISGAEQSARRRVFRIVSQKRGSSGNFSCPPCTCILPYSAQRCERRHRLARIEQSRRIEGALDRVKGLQRRAVELLSTSGGSSRRRRRARRSRCHRPRSTARGSRSRTASARTTESGSFASNMISGCRLPSPAWKTLAQRRSYFFSMRRDRLQHLAEPLARDRAVHAVVIR